MSVGLVILGLLLALVLDVPSTLRVYGWVLVGVGVLGLASRYAIAWYQERENRAGRSR
jgi:hypothetical protein